MTDNPSVEVTQELLPCPFCGGAASIEPENWAGRDFIGVFCNECLIFQDSRSATNAEAITAWNTRLTHTDAEVSADLAEAGKVIEFYGERSNWGVYRVQNHGPRQQTSYTKATDDKGERARTWLSQQEGKS